MISDGKPAPLPLKAKNFLVWVRLGSRQICVHLCVAQSFQPRKPVRTFGALKANGPASGTWNWKGRAAILHNQNARKGLHVSACFWLPDNLLRHPTLQLLLTITYRPTSGSH